MSRFVISAETAQKAASGGRKSAIQYCVRKYRKMAGQARYRAFSFSLDTPIFSKTCPLCLLYMYSSDSAVCPLIGEACTAHCSSLWYAVLSAWRYGDRLAFRAACLRLARRLNVLLVPKDRI